MHQEIKQQFDCLTWAFYGLELLENCKNFSWKVCYKFAFHWRTMPNKQM